jgi:predicted AAA+ superfamily ATPase
MIKRQMTSKLTALAEKFPVVAVIGPRQSGKTTLVKSTFSEMAYVSLEDPDQREFALSDPRGFLSHYAQGAIFDEIQRVPSIFSYMQAFVDARKKTGLFILTGSHNFLLLENLSQSLAGRVAILKLLPFSLEELKETGLVLRDADEYLYRGFYPRIYDQHIAPNDWYPNYIQTYIERDVRLIKNISDLNAFQRFVKLCAGRTGQILNLSSLGDDCGITHNTAKAWLSILEASFIIFLLRPHYKNFSKRLIKMPKLYFYDTGLAASLLGIENQNQLATHYLKGSLFEGLIISELIKYRHNEGQESNFYFWRDKMGLEIDCIIERSDRLIPIEIKAGKTITSDYFNNLQAWNKLAGGNPADSFVIYAGDENQTRSGGKVLSWKEADSVFTMI